MTKTIIRLRKTLSPEKLVYLGIGEVVVQPHIAAMEACGWFVTHMIKRTDKTNLLLTSVQTNYVMRDEGVREGCYFKNNHEFSCGVCKQII